jgi:hypothetical protein
VTRRHAGQTTDPISVADLRARLAAERARSRDLRASLDGPTADAAGAWPWWSTLAIVVGTMGLFVAGVLLDMGREYIENNRQTGVIRNMGEDSLTGRGEIQQFPAGTRVTIILPEDS